MFEFPGISCNSVVEQCTVAWQLIGSAPSEETKIFRLEISEALYTTINSVHLSSLVAESNRYIWARFALIQRRVSYGKIPLLARVIFLPALSETSQSVCVALQDKI